jgi:hypothetical protein
MAQPQSNSDNQSPICRLSRADQDLITELTLHSGSLKALAKSFGVSYPTIRRRLDEVIERLRVIVDGREPEPLIDLLADLVRRGEITPSAARAVRDMHRAASSQATGKGQTHD